MGTSLQVSPVNRLVDMVGPSVPQILINRELVGDGHNFDAELLGDCDAVVQHLMELLKSGAGDCRSKTPYKASSKFAHRWIFRNGVDDVENSDEEDSNNEAVDRPPETATAARADHSKS